MKKFLLILVCLILTAASSAALYATFKPSSPPDSSSIEDSSSEPDSSIPGSSEEPSESSSSEEPSSSSSSSSASSSSSSEVPVALVPFAMAEDSSNDPVLDDLNAFTGFLSGYRDQYSNQEDPASARYFGGSVQEASNVFSLGWTTTSVATMTSLIPEINTYSATAKYSYIASNYWIWKPASISVSYTSATTSTYSPFILVRAHGVEAWTKLMFPGYNASTIAAAGGTFSVNTTQINAALPLSSYVLQVCVGFMSTNTSAKVSGLTLAITF